MPSQQTSLPNRPRVGVGVIIIKDSKILLGERKNAHGAGTWAPPGGHLEFGESFEECAKREVLEETGLHVQEVRKYGFTNDFFVENNTHYVTIFMCAQASTGEPRLLEPEKCVRWTWFDLNELPANLFKPLQTLIEQELMTSGHTIWSIRNQGLR